MRTIKIGRSNECDIVLTYDKISRIHAELSYNGGQYIYHDMSKNGTNIGGRIVVNEKVIIAPGSSVLIANKIPLPWDQIYPMLNPKGYNASEAKTTVEVGSSPDMYQPIQNAQQSSYKEDKLGIGWGILAFIIPIAGWIMYFSWKDETPNRANSACILATISFVLNVISVFVMM